MPQNGADGGEAATPASKKQRLSGSPLLATPTKVLETVRKGEETDESKVLQALCNAVISAADGEEGGEDEEAVRLLTELLEEDGIDPNCGDDEVLRRFGGSPLYQACKLDVPEAVRTLLDHGASLVRRWDGETPLEVAITQKSIRCTDVILDHVGKLERQAGEKRARRRGAAA